MIRRILTVNGVEKTVAADPGATLAEVLREHLFLTGTKVGCGKGECGACSVVLNGKLVRSCIVKRRKWGWTPSSCGIKIFYGPVIPPPPDVPPIFMPCPD
ncbi:MAG: 2Fe-2S iron-sulfur cluster-binding protein [Pseudomonadota bacterium]